MKRLKSVEPDYVIDTPDGQFEAVSLEQLAGAMVQAANVLDFSGGVIEVAVGRRPTGTPGEFFTARAVIQWKDRLGERAASPEAPDPVAQPLQEPEAKPKQFEVVPPGSGAVEEPVPSGPDGLDPATLQDEDTDSISASMAG